MAQTAGAKKRGAATRARCFSRPSLPINLHNSVQRWRGEASEAEERRVRSWRMDGCDGCGPERKRTETAAALDSFSKQFFRGGGGGRRGRAPAAASPLRRRCANRRCQRTRQRRRRTTFSLSLSLSLSSSPSLPHPFAAVGASSAVCR